MLQNTIDDGHTEPTDLKHRTRRVEAVGTVGLEISVITGIMRGSHCGGQAVIAER